MDNDWIKQLSSHKKFILKYVPIWWLSIALFTLIPISYLQPANTIETTFISIFLIPISLYLIPYIAMNSIKLRNINYKYLIHEKWLIWSFHIIVLIFIFNIITTGALPILSGNPSHSRLDWDFRYITVVSDILIRVNFLLVLSKYVIGKKLKLEDLYIIITTLIYYIAIVARGSLIECVFYILFAYIIKNSSTLSKVSNSLFSINKRKFYLIVKALTAIIFIFILFSLLGDLRESNREMITYEGYAKWNAYEYMQIRIPLPDFIKSPFAWLWGYLVASVHNLNLLVIKDFKNTDNLNVLGPLLQSFKIREYSAIDDYIYIGKVNAGSAFRSYFLDYGPYYGTLIFSTFWGFISSIPFRIKTQHGRIALIMLIVYCGGCIPFAARIEVTPFLLSIILISYLSNKSSNRSRRSIN